VLGGYDTVLNRVDVMEDFLKAATREPAGTDSDELRSYIDQTVGLIGVVNKCGQVGLRQFIEFRDEYSLPGAATHGSPAKVEVTKAGKVKTKSVRSKFANLVCMSDEEIADMVNEKGGAIIFPFRKIDEPAKTRVVQSYDTRSFVRCSYLTSFIGDYNAGLLWTTLGMERVQRASARVVFTSLNKDTDLIGSERMEKASLDQSEFDQRQDKSVVMYVIESLRNHIVKGVRDDLKAQVSKLFDIEMASFEAAGIWEHAPDGKRKLCDWKSGLPSGHKWTALIGSILNRSETLVAARRLGIDIVRGLWQGDDGVVAYYGHRSSEQWSRAYADIGLKLNALKTWVSRDRFEFLHEVHEKDCAWAFPARAFKSVIWRKPFMGDSGFTPPHIERRQLLDTLQKCARRGLVDMLGIARRMVASELQGSGERHAHIRADEILMTPSTLGGLGWGTTGRRAIMWSTPKVKYSEVRISSTMAIRGESKVVEAAVLRRLGQLTPLPVTRSKARSYVVEEMETPAKNVAICKGRPCGQWHLGHARTTQNPWQKKILLEFKLATGARIFKRDVPDRIVAESPMGVDRAARMLERMSGWSPSFESSVTSGEPLAAVADLTNKMWSFVCHRMMLCRMQGQSEGWDMLKAQRDIASLAWKRICVGPSGVRVEA
jgi:hypothetical protein